MQNTSRHLINWSSSNNWTAYIANDFESFKIKESWLFLGFATFNVHIFCSTLSFESIIRSFIGLAFLQLCITAQLYPLFVQKMPKPCCMLCNSLFTGITCKSLNKLQLIRSSVVSSHYIRSLSVTLLPSTARPRPLCVYELGHFYTPADILMLLLHWKMEYSTVIQIQNNLCRGWVPVSHRIMVPMKTGVLWRLWGGNSIYNTTLVLNEECFMVSWHGSLLVVS